MRKDQKISKKCECCGHEEYDFDVEFICDNCKKQIPFDPPAGSYLNASIFHDNEDETLDFCSWKCFFEKMEEISKTDFDFISLPYLQKNKNKCENIDDFLNYIKRI